MRMTPSSSRDLTVRLQLHVWPLMDLVFFFSGLVFLGFQKIKDDLILMVVVRSGLWCSSGFRIQDSKDAAQVQRIEPALIPSRKEYFNSGLIR